MSTHFVKFFSRALLRNGEFWVFLVDKHAGAFMMKDNPYYQRDAKTLILLHGFNGDCMDWLINGHAAEISQKYNLNIVMPNGGLDFYVDKKESGHRYKQFIGEDLVNYLRDTFNIATKKEDTYIGGFSMGGYGSLTVGLSYTDTFGGIIALSSALITYNMSSEGAQGNRMVNTEYYTSIFGDLDQVVTSDFNPEVLYTKDKEANKEIPAIYLACGKQDFLIQPNYRFRDFLAENNADFLFEENDGIHNWDFWIPHVQRGIEYILKKG